MVLRNGTIWELFLPPPTHAWSHVGWCLTAAYLKRVKKRWAKLSWSGGFPNSAWVGATWGGTSETACISWDISSSTLLSTPHTHLHEQRHPLCCTPAPSSTEGLSLTSPKFRLIPSPIVLPTYAGGLVGISPQASLTTCRGTQVRFCLCIIPM